MFRGMPENPAVYVLFGLCMVPGPLTTLTWMGFRPLCNDALVGEQYLNA